MVGRATLRFWLRIRIMYTPANLSGVSLQFDTAVRKGDLDSLRLCLSCEELDKTQILHNDEKYGYLGLCLARFPSDRHGGTHSSMSAERRDARLSMAELLLDFGCSCNPKFVGIDHIEHHTVTALLRYPDEYETLSTAEKNREIALCRRLIDGGAPLDFFREFPEHRALVHLLMSHHWLGMLRDIKEFHVLGAQITEENLANVFSARLRPNTYCFDFPMLGRTVELNYVPGHPNALTVLALCNNCAVPEWAYHALKWDHDGVLVEMFHQHGWNPSALHNDKTVLRTWVETLVSNPYYLDAAYNVCQLTTFATHHPQCFGEVVNGTTISDMVVARVNALNAVKTPYVSNNHLVIQCLFEDTQQIWQRHVLQTTVEPYTTQSEGKRKI